MKYIFAASIMLILALATAISLADEGMIFLPDVAPPANQQKSPLALAHYDEKTFELAYQTFIYGGNVEDAYALSLGAVKHNPHSIVWRERLAQTALWTNRADDALEQYIYLIRNDNQLQYFPPALKLATQLRRYDSLIPLLEFEYQRDPTNVAVMNTLADAYDQIGDPNRAIQFLQQSNKKQPRLLFVRHIAHIYRNLGESRHELNILDVIEKKYGLTAPLALRMAQIEYGHARPQRALNKMKMVPHQNKIHNLRFWQTEARLAWLLGEDKTSRYAYLKLYQLHGDVAEDIRRLILLQPKSAERQTLKFALYAWRRFQSIEGFLVAASIAPELRDWGALASLYHTPMSLTVRHKLESESDYWNGQALLLQFSGEPKAARLYLLNAVLKYPRNRVLPLAYLNFLQAQLSLYTKEQQPQYFQVALSYWQAKAGTTHNWATAYAKAFMLLDEPYPALKVYQLQRNTSSNDFDWNIRYTDALDSLFYSKSAFISRQALWFYMQAEVPQHDASDLDFWSAFASLANYFAPTQIGYPVAAYLAQHNDSTSAADVLLNWSIGQNNFELAAYLLAYYYADDPPAYATFKVAIMRNDQGTLLNMLTTMAPVIPRKDAVVAAQQMGEIPLAQQLAYEGATRSRDAESYKEMTDLMLTTADDVVVGSEYEQFGSLQGPRALLNAKLFIDYAWNVKPYASIWDPKTNNIGDLASHSYVEKIAGIILARDTERSHLRFDVGEHRALYNSYNAEIRGDYFWTSKLKLVGTLDYNRRSLLSVFMLVAGSQDDVIVEADYDMTVRDKFMGSLELDNYYLQDRTSLGSGYVVSAAAEHKLWVDYPDFTVGLSANIDRFNSLNSLLQGRVLKIFPTNIAPIPVSLISKNFWQVEFHFSFGDSLHDNYTHDFRPYANLGVLYDSTAGTGPDIDVGIAGSVIGRDKLAFYYTRSTTTKGSAASNFLFGARYELYF